MSTVAKSTQFYSRLDPRAFGGCILWLDGADPAATGIPPANSSSVNTWVDKSRASNDATKHPSYSAPTFASNDLNGRGGLSFTGTSTYTLTSPISAGTALTSFVVGRGSNNPLYPGNSGNLITGRGATSNHGSFYISIKSDNMLLITNTSDVLANANVATSFGVNYIITSFFDNRIVFASTNGGTATAQTAFSGTNKANLATYIGNNFFAGAFNNYGHAGSVNEIILFQAALSRPQRQAIEGYLAQKWGLQSSLPPTHPYRSIGTFIRPLQPIDLSGCVMWFDAADRGTFTFSSGSNISVWSNKAARTDSIALWDSTAVLVSPGTLGNSVPHVRFSNYAYSSAILGYGGNTGETIFMVGNNPSTTLYLGTTRWVTVPPNTNPAAWGASHVLNLRSNAVRGEIQGSAATNVTISSLPARTKLAVSIVTATTLSVFESGTAGAANPVALTLNQTNGNIRVGTPVGTASDLGELIYYNRPLTTTERQCVEGYLAQKWGLQSNLPTTHPFYLSRILPSTALFSPSNLSNCTLWIDAADTATITFSNSNVVSINDKSSTGYNLTRSYTAGFEITYADRLNGLPTLLFPNDPVNNNNTRTFLSNAGNFTINTSLHACFFVMRFNPYVLQGTSTPRSWGQIFPFNMNAANGFQCGPNRTTSNWNLTYGLQGLGTSATNTTVISSSSNGPAAPGLPVIGSIVRTGTTTYAISYNGILQTITGGSTLAAAAAPVRVGIYFQNQELCELLFFNGNAMPLDDIRRVEGYLAWKWGIRNVLPVTHPHYEIRP